MRFAHDDYTVAWICALPLEMAAAKTMLDETHDPLDQPANDNNAYTLGQLANHMVVIACLPSGIYGTTSAAAVLAQMLPTFPCLRFGLMVGIGGGVPSRKVDIRLGDIVVSMPTATSGGVVQYDYGKALTGSFERIGVLNKPPLCLLTAISKIRCDNMIEDIAIDDIVSQVLQKYEKMQPGFSRPDTDWLFPATYDHGAFDPDCSTCDQNQRINRVPRENQQPHIHYGLIASGNQVMKNARTRDTIAQEMDILCFEMEAAGLLDQLPCLVIRGICDYCDSHKNKQWQGYAALGAAAYAKVLLSAVPIPMQRNGIYEINNAPMTLSDGNKDCLRSIGFREQDHRYNEVYSAKHTCTWLLEDPQYQAWLASPRGLLWIKGNPGSGKSVLMKFAVQSMANIESGETVVSFFINGRGTALQKTPLGVFRALLNSMLPSFPDYLSRLTQQFDDREKRFGDYQEGRWNWMEQELQDIMSQVLADGTKCSPVLIFLDALDECGEDAARRLLIYFKNLMKEVERKGALVKICFSSRHYPILGPDTVQTICVEGRNDRDIQFVIKDLLKEIEPEEKRQELGQKILSKAQGGFQWTVLVCKRVLKEAFVGAKLEKLHRMIVLIPEALDQLYSCILSDIPDAERHQVLKLFRWVLFAERPLSTQELRDALSIDIHMDCKSTFKSHESWSDTLEQFETHVTNLSRGLIEFQTRDLWEKYDPDGEDFDREAQFIHQSVAEFLQVDFLRRIEHDFSHCPTGGGHYQISRACLRYATLDEVLECAQLPRSKLWTGFQLVPYTVQFLFRHIQKVEQEDIPQKDLLPLMQWDNPSKLGKLSSLWRTSDPDSTYTPLGWPFIGATKLHVIAALGSKSAFEDCIERGDTPLDVPDHDGNTPLMIAIREGHSNIAISLLDWAAEIQLNMNGPFENLGLQGHQPVNVNAKNDDGETPLTIAVTQNAQDVILKLIEARADLKCFGREADLISFSIRSKNMIILQKLIQKKVNLTGAVYYTLRALENDHDALRNFLDELLKAGGDTSRLQGFDGRIEYERDDDSGDDSEEEGNSYMQGDQAILAASRRGQVDAVRILLSHGISATIQNERLETPLFEAVKRDHKDVALVLLQHEPSGLAYEDENGDTPLKIALHRGNVNTALILITEGTFLPANSDLIFTLHTSCMRGYVHLIEAVLQKDKTLLESTMNDKTPLEHALLYNHTKVVDVLLENGATPGDSYTRARLLLEVQKDHVDAAAINSLLNEGANIEATDINGQTPLLLAVQKDHPDPAIIVALLDKGANIEATDAGDYTPLVIALQKDHPDPAIIIALLDKGANIEATDAGDYTPLVIALQKDHPDPAIIIALLDKGANVEAIDTDNHTPLVIAVQKDHPDPAIVVALLDKGANAEATNIYGETPLLLALQKDDPDPAIIVALLDKGANVEVTDAGDYTPLLLAVQKDHPDPAIVITLLDKGANVEATDAGDYTPLVIALQKDHPDPAIVVALLDKGANIEAIDADGHTPLLLALQKDHPDPAIIIALLDKGANVEATDTDNHTPLVIAVQKDHPDPAIVVALLDKGADAEATNIYSETPLLLAVQKDDPDPAIVVALLDKGANIEVTDAGDYTPLLLALQKDHPDPAIVITLLDKGANVEATDAGDYTPLVIALQKDHPDPAIVVTLLDKGANIEAIDANGHTPLLLALQKDHPDPTIVVALLDKGANAEATNIYGETPLLLAVQKDHPDPAVVAALLDKGANAEATDFDPTRILLVVQKDHPDPAVMAALLDRGANIEATDIHGRTPILLEIEKPHPDNYIMSTLLDRGANIEATDIHGQTPLLLAVQKDPPEPFIVEALLKKGANFEVTDINDRTPLLLAVHLGNQRIMNSLLKSGANIEATDNLGQTALLRAVQKDYYHACLLVWDLLAHGANVDVTDSLGQTPLLLAVHLGYAKIIRKILEKGANIEATDNFGRTALLLAVQKNYYHSTIIVATLLEKGANLEATDSAGHTALVLAVKMGYIDIVDTLLEKGANIESMHLGHTPLLLAVRLRDITISSILLEKGANPNVAYLGHTPLSLALRMGDMAIASALLGKGADFGEGSDPQATKDSSETLLLMATQNNNYRLSSQLLRRGVNPNAKDISGMTPLCLAATAGNELIMELLIGHGADINQSDFLGWTPLLIAAKNGHTDSVKLLLENGANMEAVDKLGQTALDLSSKSGHADVTKSLLQHRTNSNSNRALDRLDHMNHQSERGGL